MLRTLEQATGNGFKAVLPCEEIARKNARRSLVTNGAIKKGEKFNEKNIIAKRPGTGISPLHYDELLGLTCAENLKMINQFNQTILKKMHLLNPLQKKWF